MRIGFIGVSSSSASGPGTPGAPTNLGVTQIGGDGGADVAWSPPISDGGSAIAYYDVEYSTDEISWTVLSPSTSPRTIGGLTVGTTYYFRVRALNAIGYGPYGGAGSMTIQAKPTAASQPGSDATATPSVTTSSATTQTFSNYTSVSYLSSGTWTNPYPVGAATGTATVSGTTSLGSLDYVYGTTNGGPYGSSSSSGSLSGLLRDTTYYVRARGTNTSCTATFNGTVNPRGASTTVDFEYSTSSGSYTNTVAASTSPVTGYTSQSVSANVGSLAAGTYYYRVRASNVYGTVFSSERSITVSAKSATGAQLSFTPPAVKTIFDVIVVSGGGGGGGGDGGGGGGGGGADYWSSRPVGSYSSLAVVVGGGGAGGIDGASGGASSLGGFAFNDGGSGGFYNVSTLGRDGGMSGSGLSGGAGFVDFFGTGERAGGGGGGQSTVGQDATSTKSGNGGSGLFLPYAGSSNGVYTCGWGGGGGGNVSAGVGSPAPLPGDSNGGDGAPSGNRNAPARSGGGGGGGYLTSGGNGGSGIIIFYYYGP